VLAMAKLLNIPAQEVATIGDMPNDVLVFEKSGVSIAMGNARSEVQASATYVTSTNEDQGFAKAIEEFVLGKRAVKM
jgi:hydroxymethylpyrimidine pyrophosphatase-like HAD family hydrolase